MIEGDNGTGLTGLTILRSARDRHIEWHCIAPDTQRQSRGAGPVAQAHLIDAAGVALPW